MVARFAHGVPSCDTNWPRKYREPASLPRCEMSLSLPRAFPLRVLRAVRRIALLALVSTPAFAACPSTPASLRAHVEAGLDAFEEFDWELVAQELAVARAEADCLKSPASTVDAARLHLLVGLEATRTKDSKVATAAFRSLLAADPAFQLPEELGAQGGAAWGYLEAARVLGAGGSTEMADSDWIVDGVGGKKGLPKERAALVQRAGAPAEPRSWYLTGATWPDELGTFVAKPTTTPVAMTSSPRSSEPAAARPRELESVAQPLDVTVAAKNEDQAVVRKGLSPSGRLAVAALGTAIGSGAAFATGYYTYDSYTDGASTSLAAVNHGAIIAGYTLLAASGGLAVGAVIQGRW